MRLVFVSSTFKDMQFERDALHVRVAPSIDSFLTTYGENVHFGDLRWGVNTSDLSEEESNKKVLKICLDEIDNCKPYMIVFIGERYGWIPAKELIDHAMDMKGIVGVPDDISVTNLEIEYGALMNPDLEGRILFYFRNLDTSKMSPEDKKIYEAESDLHKQKLVDLKKRIKEKYPNFVREYNAKWDEKKKEVVNLDPLMDMVSEDLKKIFKIDLDELEKLPKEERAVISSHARFEKIYQNAYPRSDAKVYDFHVEYDERGHIKDYIHKGFDDIPLYEAIQGEQGSGRKTLLALKYKNALDQEMIAIPYYNNSDRFTEGRQCFINTLTYQIEKVLNTKHKEGDRDINDLIKAIRRLEDFQGKKIVRVFIMGYNHELNRVVKRIDAEFDELSTISFYVQECNMAKSCLPFHPHNRVIETKSISEEEQAEMISYLIKKKHKEISKPVVDEILLKEDSEYPLYLSLMVERLTMLDAEDFRKIRELGDGMPAINKYMMEIVHKTGGTIELISKELFKELMERVNPEMVKKLLALMCNTHVALNQYAYEMLFNYYGWEYNDFDYSIFQKYVPSLFATQSSASASMSFINSAVRKGCRLFVKEIGEPDHLLDLYNWALSLKPGKSVSNRFIADLKARTLYSLNDVKTFARELVDICETVPAEPKDRTKESYDYFNETNGAYITQLGSSYENEDDFHLRFHDEIIRMLQNNEIKNFYTLLDIIFMYCTRNLDKEELPKFRKMIQPIVSKYMAAFRLDRELPSIRYFTILSFAYYMNYCGTIKTNKEYPNLSISALDPAIIDLSIAIREKEMQKLTNEHYIHATAVLNNQTSEMIFKLYKEALNYKNIEKNLEGYNIDLLADRHEGFKALRDLKDFQFSQGDYPFIAFLAQLCISQARMYNIIEDEENEELRFEQAKHIFFNIYLKQSPYGSRKIYIEEANGIARFAYILLDYAINAEADISDVALEMINLLKALFADHYSESEVAIALLKYATKKEFLKVKFDDVHLFNLACATSLSCIKDIDKALENDTFDIGACVNHFYVDYKLDYLLDDIIFYGSDNFDSDRPLDAVAADMGEMLSCFSYDKKIKKTLCESIASVAFIEDKKKRREAEHLMWKKAKEWPYSDYWTLKV